MYSIYIYLLKRQRFRHMYSSLPSASPPYPHPHTPHTGDGSERNRGEWEGSLRTGAERDRLEAGSLGYDLGQALRPEGSEQRMILF